MDFVERMAGRNWNPQTFLKFSNLDARVQKHLSKVYATLACAVLVTALGVYVDLLAHIGGLLTFLGGLGCLIALSMTPSLSENYSKRYALLGGFAFCQGCSIAPLVGQALDVNPGLLITAGAATVAVFGCFTVSALLTTRRAYLFLGGYLSSAVLGLMAVRLGGWMLGSAAAAFEFELYAGVLIFAGYILFDTQLIVERASAGDMDHIRHSLDLLVDLIALFVRVLIILMKNNSKKEEERKKKDRR